MTTTDKFVFFWNGIYSQWYDAPFTIDGISFNTCEQYMMYKKALLFGDKDIAKQILSTSIPDEQKSLGRMVKGFDRTIWDQHCFSIVYEANLAKFSQNPELKKELIATGNRVIVEASPGDFIWGVKMRDTNENIESPEQWSGLNLLGFAIMTVRNQLTNA
jgi:ribA/ribD-fused uncharacterized protein